LKSDEYIRSMMNQKFGVEIEFTGITKSESIEVVDKHNSVTNMKFEIVHDSSIMSVLNYGGTLVYTDSDELKNELVTPILSGSSDITKLLDIVKELKAKGACVTATCGIHIHVSGDGHTPKSLKSLTNLMLAREDMFVKAFKITNTRLDRYCNKLDENFVKDINEGKVRTLNDVRYVWYGDERELNSEYDSSRYKMMNLHSFFSGKGIEFRLFNSTLNATLLESYINFCLAMNYYALRMKKSVNRRSSRDNERYGMRNFLNRIALSGPQFKDTRKSILSNLPGDSSFKVPENHNRRRLEIE